MLFNLLDKCILYVTLSFTMRVTGWLHLGSISQVNLPRGVGGVWLDINKPVLIHNNQTLVLLIR